MKRRTVKKQFWFSRDEAQDLQKKAKKTCLTEAALVRLLVRGYEPKERPDERFYDVMRQLSSIGNNINQLAAQANSLSFVDAQKLQKEAERWHKFQALADVLRYAKDEEKTEREFYVGGINCNASTARDQFVTVKEQFDKCDGIQVYHGYLSFKDEPNITPELAQQIGTEFAKRVWGDRFQVVVTTHLNTKHLHCHFVVNSVSFVDGKRMQNNEKHWRYFRHIADELCRQHQLNVIENPKRGTGKNYYARKLHEAGMPNYVDSAKAVIDEAISKSNSYADFKYILRQMGATFDDSPNHKYQVLRIKGYQKNIRLTRLGEDYSLERIKERIYENRNRVKLEPFQKGYYYRPKQYVLLTREHKIRKVGGLYGLYLHYCYKLGYLPKYQKQNPARLHYLLREDLMKLDQITAQVRLLGREHISTSEQLFSYKSKVEDEIKTLTADRTHLRNEIRKVNIDDDLLSGKRQQISALSERLKELRKEVRLCDGIAERSGVMRENLDAVLADEEKIKNNRKENRDYEHRR